MDIDALGCCKLIHLPSCLRKALPDLHACVHLPPLPHTSNLRILSQIMHICRTLTSQSLASQQSVHVQGMDLNTD